MDFKNIIYFLIFLLAVSCDNNKRGGVQTSEEVSKSIKEATKNTISFEGKFVKIEKLNSKEYYLYLKDSQDSILSFLTIMPLDENEIRLLKTEGNNIKLQYDTFYNPVRKKTDNVVKYMQPIYKFEEK